MEEAIAAFLDDLRQASGEENERFFAVVILDRKTDYPRVKAMLTRLDLLS